MHARPQSAPQAVYEPPEIFEYGSVVELTARGMWNDLDTQGGYFATMWDRVDAEELAD